MGEVAVRRFRVVLVVDDVDAAVSYFRDGLNLTESAAVTGTDGAGTVVLDAGRAALVLAGPARHPAGADGRPSPDGAVELEFQVDDAAAATAALTGTGARVLTAPAHASWNAVRARLGGPAGVPVTLIQKPGDGADPARLVGADIADLGGEPGALAWTVELARRHGAGGQLPFAAITARDGTVIGAGANTALSDHDPSAHGEVAAIRDACRRTESADLAGAVVYSSCEPCAICRAVAAAAGVCEIVFAAGRDSVPIEINPRRGVTDALAATVSEVLPGLSRRGETGLDRAALAAPFRAYLDAVDRRTRWPSAPTT